MTNLLLPWTAIKELGHIEAGGTGSARSARSFRRSLIVRCMLAAGLLAVVADPAGAQTIPGKPANKSACLNITSYGAKTNGPDATQAIQNAINAAKSRAEKCVYIPAGTYYKGRLALDGGVKLIGDGNKSILHASDPGNHQLRLLGSGGGLYDLELHTYATARTNDNDAAVFIDFGSSNFVLDNIIVEGANGPGILDYGGQYGRITRNRVYNTKADAIHNSGGAHDIYVAGNRVRNPGDDMIAVVTYQYIPNITRNILIENNDVANQPWGRGISVVGGADITVRNNKITASSDAGIYLAGEGSWATYGDSNVLVYNNYLNRTPSAHAADHGHTSVLVFSDNGKPMTNLAIRNNTILNAPNGAIRVDVNNPGNIACQGNTLDGAATSANGCSGTINSVTGANVTASLLGGTTVGLPQ